MEVFLIVGIPFAVFLIGFTWAGYGIGGTTPKPDPASSVRATLRSRVGPAAIVVLAAALAALGAAAAATAGAFARLTDVGYPIEPAALLFLLEAVADLALAVVVILPGWSPRRVWILRTLAIYWLCAAFPIVILADAGPDWLSTNPAYGMTLLAVPAFIWEAIAIVIPALLILRVSRTRAATPRAASEELPESTDL
jgi:hypothetical protein